MANIGILIIEDDTASQVALRQMLDSEGWQVHVVSQINQALIELSTGEWSLVIANIDMMDLSGPVFLTLRELGLSQAVEEGKMRARVLFLVAEDSSPEIQAGLNAERLPFVLKPFHFHDLLEKVSDLLMETSALTMPIRRVKLESSVSERKRKEGRLGHESDRRQGNRDTTMFAKREAYVMSEEEIADFERQERDERKKKQPQDH